MQQRMIVILLSVLLGVIILISAIAIPLVYNGAWSSGHDNGYSAGHTDGYASGKSNQSSTDSVEVSASYANGYKVGFQGLADFYDWMVNSCMKDYNNYYQVVMWQGSDGTYHYNCLV